MQKITQALFYAGLEKQEMDELLPEAREENGTFLRVYTAITAMLFGICLLMSFPAGGQLAENRPVYFALIFTNILLYFCVVKLLPKRPSLSTLFTLIFILSLYAYSFSISLIRPNTPATAAVAFLLVMPCIFNYRPITMILLTVGVIAVYHPLALHFKSRSMAMLDLWNSLFFGVIAVGLSVYQMRVKFRLLLQKRRNRQLSETDLLTGVKNRNCFENRKYLYPERCQQSLACVFVDANGLHELNDSRGHESGDLMLQATAAVIKDFFDPEDIYRVGGDEFISFSMDVSSEEIQRRIRTIADTVAEKGYSVSVGASWQEKKWLDMDRLLKEAEQHMYEEKRAYYESGGHDRRHGGVWEL